ncbi:MAG: hypothetical protein PHX21_14035, partial [bacterium]|nr:hypothetical protein [bacterium]
ATNKKIKTSNLEYSKKKEYINANVTDETERTKQLDALEVAHAAEVENINSQADADYRARQNALKPIMIAEAIANTAQGFTKALAEGGIFGIITGAIVAAAGMAQVATIQAQEFAAGALAMGPTPAIFGEAGPEIALPLNHPNTTKLLSEAIDKSTTHNIGGDTININVSDSILSNRQTLNQAADLIGKKILSDVKNNRKIK